MYIPCQTAVGLVRQNGFLLRFLKQTMTLKAQTPLLTSPTNLNYGSLGGPDTDEERQTLDSSKPNDVVDEPHKSFREIAVLCFGLWTRSVSLWRS